MLKIIYVTTILTSFLLVGCNVMGDQAPFDDEFFETPYKYDKVYFKTGRDLEIGDVGIGYNFAFELRIQNDSDETIYISEKKSPVDGYFDYAASVSFPGNTGTCGGALNSHIDCNINLEVNIPTEVYKESSIEVEYYFASRPDEVYTLSSKLSARGQDKAILKAEYYFDLDYDFYQIVTGNYTSMSTIQIRNVNNSYTANSMTGVISGSAFTWTNTSPPLAGTYPGSAGDCTTSLAPASSCNLDIQFYPTTDGKFTGFAGINYDQGNGRGFTTSGLNLIGEGAGAAVISITPGYYHYGTHSTDVAHTFTAKNEGGVDATAISINMVVGGDFNISNYDCPANIPPGDSCSFDVTYEGSTATSSTNNDTINFNYNNGTGATSTSVNVHGTTP